MRRKKTESIINFLRKTASKFFFLVSRRVTKELINEYSYTNLFAASLQIKLNINYITAIPLTWYLDKKLLLFFYWECTVGKNEIQYELGCYKKTLANKLGLMAASSYCYQEKQIISVTEERRSRDSVKIKHIHDTETVTAAMEQTTKCDSHEN